MQQIIEAAIRVYSLPFC